MADPKINPVTGKPYTFGDMNPTKTATGTATGTKVDVSKLPPPPPPDPNAPPFQGGGRPIGIRPPAPVMGGRPFTAPVMGQTTPPSGAVPAIGQAPVKGIAGKTPQSPGIRRTMPDTAMRRPSSLRRITMAGGRRGTRRKK